MPKLDDKNGTGSDRQGSIKDKTGAVFTLSGAAKVAGVSGFAVNKDGADTSFPLNRCGQIFYRDGVMFGFQIKRGWLRYNGSSWIPANNPRDM